MTLVKQLREQFDRRPADLAEAAGINLPSYYDLEGNQDELEAAVPVRSVAKLAKELRVKPSAFYGGFSSDQMSVSELAVRVREHLARSAESLEGFEERIGWSVGDALADPDMFRECCADELRDICNGISVSWFDVLDHLDDA